MLGRFSLERELGRGGMGTVYLARDLHLDRPVALKVLHPALATQAESRQRFLIEARTAAGLAHPHIVPIFSVEEHAATVVIVMAFVDGETLGHRLSRRGALAPDDAERLLREVAWALGYAHARGIVHRDLTPANILIERTTGRALLADFGVAARILERGGEPVFGTPGYLAPEVIRGERARPQSDLYALGAVAYFALAGTPPFETGTPAQILARHLVQPHRPLAPLAQGASRRLIEAIEQCLAKDIDARPSDTAALLAMLERRTEPFAVAPALRTWFSRWERVRAGYALAIPLLAMQTWLLIQGYFDSGSTALLTAALISSALSLTAIPLTARLTFEAAELRRLRRVGFGVDDIRSALPHWRAEMVRERQREGLAPLAGRVIWDLTVIGALTIFVSLVFIWPNLELMGVRDAIVVRGAMTWILAGVYFGTLTGVGIGFLLPGHRPKPDGWLNSIKERFWHSELATRLVRLSTVGQRTVTAASSTLHRNTELVLGLAIDDLWKVVPAGSRSELGDVPALAHALQKSAAELRDLIDRLRESERELVSDPGERAQITAALPPIEARHRETVTALEQIRLQLLRLLATRGTTVELTQQLDAARLLEVALEREVQGHAAVRRILGRAPRRDRLAPAATPS